MNKSDAQKKKTVSFPSTRSTAVSRLQFSEQLTEHHRGLLVYARSILFDKEQAHDLVQEASITAWKKFSSYDASQGDFSAWIRGILRNKIRDWVKSKKGAARPEVSLDEEHLDFLENHFGSTPATTPSFKGLRGCLKRLPDHLKEAVQLTYYLGHTGEEASEKLAIQPATLRKRLSRARLTLHDCISAKQEAAN